MKKEKHDHTCDHDHHHDHDHTCDQTCDHDHDHDHEHHHHHDHDHDHHHHDHDASSHRSALLQAGLIAITGIMLLVKVASGTLPFYVHVRYTTLIAGTGLILLLLGVAQAWFILNPSDDAHAHDHDTHDHGHSHEPLSWRSPAMLALMVPVLLGLLVPPKALSSAAIDTRGFGNSGTGVRTVETIASQSAQAQGISFDRSNWTLLDWVNALIYQPDNPALQGEDIEVIGFVWRSEELKENEFYVARFIVSCCTADSLAIYMPVLSPNASELPMDSWVRVKGTVGLADVMGEETAVIQAGEIIPIEQPAQPYLNP